MCFVQSLQSVDVFYSSLKRGRCMVLDLPGEIDSGDQRFNVKQCCEWNNIIV